MKFSVQVIVHPDDDTEASPVVREVFAFDHGDLAPDILGLQLAEAKDLLAAVQHTLVEQQASAARSDRSHRQSGRLVYGAPNWSQPGRILRKSARSARIRHAWSRTERSSRRSRCSRSSTSEASIRARSPRLTAPAS